MAYLLIDLRTGIMDGMYHCEMEAVKLADHLEKRYPGSVWSVFENKLWDIDRQQFKGPFPPNHMFHNISKLKSYYEDKDDL